MIRIILEDNEYKDEFLKQRGGQFQPELVDIWIKDASTIIRVPYRKHWNFTVGPQIGIGYTPAGVQPYAGAGITFGYSF